MPKTLKLALAAAVPLLLLAGCADFLKGPGLSTNPNAPVVVTPDELYVGIEVAVMAQYENYPLMLQTLWAQQIAGVARQWQSYASYNAGTDNLTADGSWDQTYGPGGLKDIRQLNDSLTANGAIFWRGQDRILEALYMGTAADIWGDVPFDSAGLLTVPVPAFETQAQVYAHVLSLLDSAITDLNSTDGLTPVNDFFYKNNKAKWQALAHTLKARFIMHNAQTTTPGIYNAASLTQVIAEATLGIADSTGDFKPNHTTSPGEGNLFYWFGISRAGDVAPAEMHINLIKAAGDDSTILLPKYYIKNSSKYLGSTAGAIGDSALGIPGDSTSAFAVIQTSEYGFVSYAESQMLLAEATLLSGNSAGALTMLNAYRVTQGASNLAPAPVGAVNIHQAILREKYVRSFFSIEVWNDYLRTCYPNVPQPIGVKNSAPYVPARMPVAYSDQSTNPKVPVQPAGNPPNANNVKHLLALDGTSCIGQAQQP